MISAIMLTYNREKLLPRAIESVLAQTFRDFELIVVNNGSSDTSGAIAETYAGKDHRVRVLHRARGTIGAGRNTGLDAAHGDWITFVDDDDYVEPEYLEYLYELAKEHQADISVCGSWRETNGVREPKYVFDDIFTFDGEDAVVEMLKRERFNASNPTKLFSAHVFTALRYPETGKYDDIELMYKAFSRAEKVIISGKPLYTFMRHTSNNSEGTAPGEAPPPEQIAAYLDAFSERTRWLSERFPQKTDFWRYTELSYVLSMYEKTDDEAMKRRLEILLRQNAAAFLGMNCYYTQRDRELVQRYKELFDQAR